MEEDAKDEEVVEVEVGDAVAGGGSASCWARKNIWCKYLWAKRKMNQNQTHLNLPRQQLRKSPVLLSRVGRLPLAPLVLAVHLVGSLRRREGRAWKHRRFPIHDDHGVEADGVWQTGFFPDGLGIIEV